MYIKSKPQSNTLRSLNIQLKRGFGVREALELTYDHKSIIANSIFVTDRRKELITHIPFGILLCICQTTECCIDPYNCNFCKNIVDALTQRIGPEKASQWYIQDTVQHLYTIYNKYSGEKVCKVQKIPTIGQEVLMPVVEPCRYGDACYNYASKKCKYYHPTVPTKCNNGPTCQFYKLNKCRFSHE